METLMARRSDRMDTIVSLCKRRGIVFPSSEIYGGLRASWDYGPLGVEMKNSIKRQWWRTMVTERDDIVGLDSSVILAREVWEASGHVTEFTDPLTECMSCHKRFRADHLVEAYEGKHGHPPEDGLAQLACPNCGTRGAFTEPRNFNGLLRTYLGPVEDESGQSACYRLVGPDETDVEAGAVQNAHHRPDSLLEATKSNQEERIYESQEIRTDFWHSSRGYGDVVPDCPCRHHHYRPGWLLAFQ